MEDIIATVAWECDGKGCPTRWHRANYWIHDDGTYSVDHYSDGDHDECEGADLPTDEQVRDSWVAYSRYVAEAGSDPLGEFHVAPTRKVKTAWQFRFAPIIGGVILFAARQGGGRGRGEVIIDPEALPEYVREYLNLKGRRLMDFASHKEATECGVKVGAVGRTPPWHHATIEHTVPNHRYVEQLRAAARRHVRKSSN